MKIGKKLRNGFCIAIGVRQECPLNLLLFDIKLVDFEGGDKCKMWRGNKVRKEKMYTLVYDIVSIVEGENKMRSIIMEKLEIFSEKEKNKIKSK